MYGRNVYLLRFSTPNLTRSIGIMPPRHIVLYSETVLNYIFKEKFKKIIDFISKQNEKARD